MASQREKLPLIGRKEYIQEVKFKQKIINYLLRKNSMFIVSKECKKSCNFTTYNINISGWMVIEFGLSL